MALSDLLDPKNFQAEGSGIGGLLGIAGGLYSGITGSQDAKRITDIQKQELSTEDQQNALRRDAMRLTSQRQDTEFVRRQQFASGMGLTIGTSGGSQFSTNTQAARQGASSQGSLSRQQNSLNEQFGMKMFGLMDQLNLQQRQMADAQSKLQSDTALGGMLGGIGKSLGNIGQLASLFAI